MLTSEWILAMHISMRTAKKRRRGLVGSLRARKSSPDGSLSRPIAPVRRSCQKLSRTFSSAVYSCTEQDTPIRDLQSVESLWLTISQSYWSGPELLYSEIHCADWVFCQVLLGHSVVQYNVELKSWEQQVSFIEHSCICFILAFTQCYAFPPTRRGSSQ